jgi:hypothetical protein
MTRQSAKLLLLGTLGLLFARLALSLLRSGPVLVADEIGYLMNARLLAGGVPGQLALAPFYHGGYSLLLAPLLALTSAPGLGYHLVLALNALLAASVFPLLYVLLTRGAGIAPRVAIGPAFAAAAYPSVTILSQVAMSENLLFPLTCVWLIAVCELIAHPQRRPVAWAVGSGAAAGLAYAAHGRMVVAVIVTAAVLLSLAWRRELAPAPALMGLLTLGVGLVATQLLDAYLTAHNYGGHVTNEATARLSALEHPSAIVGAVENVAGQGWSLLVATFGLAGLVCAVGLRELRTTTSRHRAHARPAVLVTLATAGLLLIVSAVSFPVRTRADMLIYTRYAEVVAPPLIALGLARLVTDRPRLPRLRWAAAFAALTAFVAIVQSAGGLGEANRWNVASFPFVTSDFGPKVLVGAAIIAVACAWALRESSLRRTGVTWLLAAVLFVPVTAYALRQPVLQAEHAVYPSGWTSPERAAGVAGARTVAYDLDRLTGGAQGYPTVGDLYPVQWFLPHARVLLFHGRLQPPPARFVLSDPGWGARHPGLRPTSIWAGTGRPPTDLWQIRKQPRR